MRILEGTVMALMPRKFVVDEDEVGMYHCINRCVRRAFLCGTDEVSGKCFDHRKQFIQDRRELLAGVFGIDVLAFAVMSNHLHVVLRNRPDVVKSWSDDEVARRWWRLFPTRRDDSGEPAEPRSSDLSMISSDPEKLAEIRWRLSNIGWLMRCVAEPVAPPLPRTRAHARSILERDTTASISISGNTPLTAERRLRAGCSNDAGTVDPGRDTESVCRAGHSPRVESFDGSSLFFIVRSFPTSLECDTRYYDLG
jgi:hypothetical protein